MWVTRGSPCASARTRSSTSRAACVDNDSVWGRPAGVAITRDGALLVSEDANGTIFRVTRK